MQYRLFSCMKIWGTGDSSELLTVAVVYIVSSWVVFCVSAMCAACVLCSSEPAMAYVNAEGELIEADDVEVPRFAYLGHGPWATGNTPHRVV